VAWEEWTRTVEVEPSIYAADFARLGEQVDLLLEAGARVFHFDVGDGHFVPSITMGPIVLQAISRRIHERGGVIDCHLMIETPERQFEALAAAGGDSVTVHLEACEDLPAVASAARRHGLGVGMAFKPETEVEDAGRRAIAAGVDIVLCMSIEPGYSGQAFMPAAVERIRAIRRLLPSGMRVQVDGGINSETIRLTHDAGASLFVAGASVFGGEDPPQSYRRLVETLS